MGRMSIVHRDLKPDNILLNSKQDKIYDVRIADFGFATVISQEINCKDKTDIKVLCGTPGYISPEALRKEGYSLKSDIFSVGAMLFSVFTGHHLFNAEDYTELMKQNKICNLTDLDEKL